MTILSATSLQMRPSSVAEQHNSCSNLVDSWKFTKIREISRKCKGIYSQPAAGRPGSNEFYFKFPSKSLQIRLEAGLGLWETFTKPAANVDDLRNPRNLAATKKSGSKSSKNRSLKNGVDEEIGSM